MGAFGNRSPPLRLRRAGLAKRFGTGVGRGPGSRFWGCFKLRCLPSEGMHRLELRILGVLAGLCVTAVTVAAQPPTAAWPEAHLPALRELLERNASATTAELEARVAALHAAQANREAVNRERRPSLALEAFGGLRNEYTPEDNNYELELLPAGELTVAMPLFTAGAIDARQAIAELREDLAAGAIDRARRGIHAELRSAYLRYYVATAATEAAASALERQRRVIEDLTSRFEAGAIPRRQLQEEQLRLREIQLAAREAQLATRSIEGQLRLLAGGEGLPTAPDASAFDAAAEALRRLGAEVFPGPGVSNAAQELIAEKAVTREEYTVIQSQTRPQVAVVGRLYSDQLETSQDQDLERIRGDIGFQVQWNFFDWGQNKYRKLANVAEQRRLENELQWQQAQDRLAFEEMRDRREVAEERVDVSRTRFELKEMQADQVLSEQEAGGTDLVAVQEAIGEAEQARLEWRQDQFQLAAVTLQLLRLAGYDNEQLGQP